jgi:hypothetical protein
LFLKTSAGLVVINRCSSGEATTLIATWVCPAKNSPCPTPAESRSSFSPSDKLKVSATFPIDAGACFSRI